MNQYLDVNPEVAQAVAQGKPVVALESTIISHGMPYPQNVETALQVERIIRENGAVPATIAVLGGRLKAGLTKEEIVAGLVPENFVGRAPQQVEEFIAHILKPIFDANPDAVEQHANLSV